VFILKTYKEDLLEKNSLFRELLEYIDSRREIIEQRIREELSEYEEEIKEVAKYIVHGGKRLRGVLALLMAEALGGSVEKSLNAAIAIEMVHSASLALDDIIDGDLFRRGKPSSWVKYGISHTVLVSNFLIPKAQLLIKIYGFEALINVISAWLQTTIGEILDAFGETMPLSSQYEKIIDLKTGSVFKMATYLGSKSANADEEAIKVASEYGRYLGLLYQIVDDLTDVLSGDPKKLESKSIKLYLEWLGARDMKNIEEVSEKSSEKIIEYINLTISKASLLPESRYKKLLILFPIFVTYALLKEIGSLGLNYFYNRLYPKILPIIQIA